MTQTIFFIIAGLVVLLLLAYFLIGKKRLKEADTEYNALFAMGIMFLFIGLANSLTAMYIIGLVFVMTGYDLKRKTDAKN